MDRAIIMFIIDIHELTKVYEDGTKAIDGFNLQYKVNGAVLVFIGPNGAGKTTLFRILAGQLLPTNGSARILGLDVVREFKKLSRRIAFLPQDIRPPFYTLTPMDYVTTYLMMRSYPISDAKSRAREILNEMELHQYIDFPISKLSAGTAKRVLISMILAAEDPEVYFLDEPLPGLDIRSKVMLWDMIRRMCREGKTFIISSHYLEEVPIVSDYIVVMNRGIKILEGPPKETIDKVLSGYRKKIIIRGLKGDKVVEFIDPHSKVIALGDTVFIYTSDPDRTIGRLSDLDVKVEIAPVGIEDVVLILGVKEK